MSNKIEHPFSTGRRSFPRLPRLARAWRSPGVRAGFMATVARLVPQVGAISLDPAGAYPRDAIVFAAWRRAMTAWRDRYVQILAAPTWDRDGSTYRSWRDRRRVAWTCLPACAALADAPPRRLPLCGLAGCFNCWARVVRRYYGAFDRALFTDPRLIHAATACSTRGGYGQVPRVFVAAEPVVDPGFRRDQAAFWLLDRRVTETVVASTPARGRLRAALARRAGRRQAAWRRALTMGGHGGAERLVVVAVDRTGPPGTLTWVLEHRMLILVAPGWSPALLPAAGQAWLDDDDDGPARSRVAVIEHAGQLARTVASWAEIEPLAYFAAAADFARVLEARAGLRLRRSFGFLRSADSDQLLTS